MNSDNRFNRRQQLALGTVIMLSPASSWQITTGMGLPSMEYFICTHSFLRPVRRFSAWVPLCLHYKKPRLPRQSHLCLSLLTLPAVLTKTRTFYRVKRRKIPLFVIFSCHTGLLLI